MSFKYKNVRILADILKHLGAYSPPSPLALHYSDAMSPVYPDRPIRPLPKRRIRSRLSSEVAESILHSSPSAPTDRLFQIPYFNTSKTADSSASQSSSLEVQPSNSTDGDQNSYQFKGNDHGSEEEQYDNHSKLYRDQDQRTFDTGTQSVRNGYLVPKNEPSRYSKQSMSQSMASSADSIDGYDSFENTNNKKKRKIPTNGNHHSSLSAEMASMGISSAREIDVSQTDQDGGVGHYYGTGSSAISTKPGIGISGAGRGRYGRGGGRRRGARSPLGLSFNGLNYARHDDVGLRDGIAKGTAPALSYFPVPDHLQSLGRLERLIRASFPQPSRMQLRCQIQIQSVKKMLACLPSSQPRSPTQ